VEVTWVDHETGTLRTKANVTNTSSDSTTRPLVSAQDGISLGLDSGRFMSHFAEVACMQAWAEGCCAALV